jgi:hypothetical protein
LTALHHHLTKAGAAAAASKTLREKLQNSINVADLLDGR